MTNALSTTTTTPSRGTDLLEPPLPSSLKVTVERHLGVQFDYLPIVDPDEYRQLTVAIREFEASLNPAAPDAIAAMLGAIALIHHEGKFTEREQRARVKLYQAALADLPHDALQFAFAKATREMKFLPKPAELRVFAGEFLRKRYMRLTTMRALQLKHRRDYVAPPPPSGPVTVEERDEFNRNMRLCGASMRMREDGELYMLEKGQEDPAPDEAPSGGEDGE